MKELSRLELLIGSENIKKLQSKKVLIIGLGGVGSYSIEAIARSGINNLIIVDKDIIDITNLNRQLMTLHSNIGRYKTDVIEERIKDINLEANVVKITKEITKENIDELIELKPDYIIDACDTIEVKKELIRKSIKNNFKLISCMGTGNKLQPKFEIMDLSKTTYDPIAKILRKMVKDEKINKKILVVASKEKPIKTGKIIASNSYVPATAGLLLASYVINDIIGDKNE